ncbi:RING-H2 finger protein ATL80-like [Carex rostrata]
MAKTMKPINRRILSIIPRPVLQEPSNTPGPGPRAYPIQLDSTAASLCAVVLLLALFFICFFSACLRRLFSLVHRQDTRIYAPSMMAPHPRHFMRFPPPYGLDPATLQSLPVVKGRKEFGCCVVCLSDFEEKDHVKVIPRCGHRFHQGCIDVWLVMHGSCPVCRCSDMVTGSWSCSGLDSVLVNDGRGCRSESNREEIEDDGRDAKEMVRLGRSNSWGLGREMRRNGSVSRLRRTGSF